MFNLNSNRFHSHFHTSASLSPSPFSSAVLPHPNISIWYFIIASECYTLSRRPLFTTNELKHSQQEFSSPSKLPNRSNSLFSAFGPLFLRLTNSRNLYRLCTVWLFPLCVIPPSKLKIEILIPYILMPVTMWKREHAIRKKSNKKKTMNFFCFGRQYFSTTEQMSVHKNCQLTVECICVNGIAVCLCLYLTVVRYFFCCVFCT